MKRLIVALLVGGIVFGTVYAAAALLGVSGGALQMSTAVSAKCDSDGVTLGYLFDDQVIHGGDANPATDNDVIYEAQVNGIDAACIGNTLTVELFADTSNNGILDSGDTKCDEEEAVLSAGNTGANTLVLDLTTTSGNAGEPCELVGPTGLIASFVNIAGPADWP